MIARRRRRSFPALAWAIGVGLTLGCGGSRDALLRGQRYYEENQYELALAVLRELSREEPSFAGPDRARYAYLRGMTDYRLGYRREARYWLALARVDSADLDPRFVPRLEGALADLQSEVLGVRSDGINAVQSIEIQPPPGARRGGIAPALSRAPDGGVPRADGAASEPGVGPARALPPGIPPGDPNPFR